MADKFIFDLSMGDKGVREPRPFTKKEWFRTPDKSNGTYLTNQVQFECLDFASNGRYMGYNEGIFVFPLVGVAKATDASGNAVSLSTITDALVCNKNAWLNLIHSVNIEYANGAVYPPSDNVNMYLNWKLHESMSELEETLNGDFISYSKDTSNSWSYNATANSQGEGICNNNNALTVNAESYADDNNGRLSTMVNSGLVRRQQKLMSYKGMGRNAIFSDDAIKEELLDYVDNSSGQKIYYISAFIRAKDLPFFDNLPLIRGAPVRVTFTMNNNVSFKINKAATTGVITLVGKSISNTTSATNPYIVPASRIATKTVSVTTVGENFGTPSNSVIHCGLSEIPNNTDLEYSFKIQKNGGFEHKLDRCYLYCPAYTMDPSYEAQYLAQKIRKINFNEVEYCYFEAGAGKNFQYVITAGSSRMSRVIIIPIMSPTGNNDINPVSSPFSTEPSTTSPCSLSQLAIYLGGDNLYKDKINFSFENFLNQHINNGKNANMQKGDVSSMVNLSDYANIYNYIVADLGKHSEEFDNSVYNLRFEGKVSSLKPITFHIFVEKMKSISVDVSTGVRVDS